MNKIKEQIERCAMVLEMAEGMRKRINLTNSSNKIVGFPEYDLATLQLGYIRLKEWYKRELKVLNKLSKKI